MHAWKLIRAVLITGIIGTSLAVPVAASADPPPTSAVNVSQTTLRPGDTFTITQSVYNSLDVPIQAGKATLYTVGANLPDWLEIVSCPEATAGCGVYNGEEFRAGFGDMQPGESRTVTWTLHVKDTAPAGSFVLWHVLLGDNYGFTPFAGPTMTITPNQADIAVSMTASVQVAVTARITYTITVKNNGPADATGIRVVGTYPAGLVYVGSTCTRVGTTRSVNCDIASLAAGASTTRTLSTATALLTVGALTATAQRTASSPDDPVASNDKATRTCNALTGLIVRC